MTVTTIYTCDRCDKQIEANNIVPGPIILQIRAGDLLVKSFATRFTNSKHLCKPCLQLMTDKLDTLSMNI